MRTPTPRARRRLLAAVLALPAFAACGDDGPTEPDPVEAAVATLRSATSRYHDLNAALADGFVFLHGCETRPGEGPVGTVYVHMGRLTDGRVDPASPEALIYEPARGGGTPTLVGIEFAVPDQGQAPPQFLGIPFQREEEFGVYGLHAWVWRDNPEGMFAESNPRVSCGAA